MGVYHLINPRDGGKKIEIHINGKYHGMSFPGEITMVRPVKVGDKITGYLPSFFNKKVMFEFFLSENEVQEDHSKRW